VKKRWRAIYDRVADIDPDLLPPEIAYGPHASSRGTERRKAPARLLRQHFEELRRMSRRRDFAAEAVAVKAVNIDLLIPKRCNNAKGIWQRGSCLGC